ncbi:MAG: hypothetical protein SFV18_18210 [Bryobacteraceae bacterium]|nr:hypothetical protein [Bryobacteraceae bacterium]
MPFKPHNIQQDFDSWKGIANYLKVSVRTAQEYEKHHGLPIHRLRGLVKSRVWAVPSELDAWKNHLPARGLQEIPLLNTTPKGLRDIAIDLADCIDDEGKRKHLFGSSVRIEEGDRSVPAVVEVHPSSGEVEDSSEKCLDGRLVQLEDFVTLSDDFAIPNVSTQSQNLDAATPLELEVKSASQDSLLFRLQEDQNQNQSKMPLVAILSSEKMRRAFLLAIGMVVLSIFGWSIGAGRLTGLFRAGGAPPPAREKISSPLDETEIRRVVRESQLFETLRIYVAPKAFDRSKLNDFWVPADRGGRAIQNIEAAVQRQISRGTHYGDESKVEMFEIFSLAIFSPGDYAEVRTKERWYVPMYRDDGSRVVERSPFLGPYQVDYTLRKIDGKWLIQSAGTPYAQ